MGIKLVLAMLSLQIVGSVVTHDGWCLSHGTISKVLKWGKLRNVTDVHSFLETAGVGYKWIKGFAIIAYLLIFLTQKSEHEFFFDDEAQKAQAELKKLVLTAPVLIKVNYNLVKPFSSPDKIP